MYGYEDEEVVTFSDEEWQVMQDDPCYFGYSCQSGHALREDDPFVIANGCPTCFHIGESAESWFYGEDDPSEEEVAKFNAWADSFRVFPVLDCPHCGSTHVGTGAIERCAGYKERGVRLRRR